MPHQTRWFISNVGAPHQAVIDCVRSVVYTATIEHTTRGSESGCIVAVYLRHPKERHYKAADNRCYLFPYDLLDRSREQDVDHYQASNGEIYVVTDMIDYVIREVSALVDGSCQSAQSKGRDVNYQSPYFSDYAPDLSAAQENNFSNTVQQAAAPVPLGLSPDAQVRDNLGCHWKSDNIETLAERYGWQIGSEKFLWEGTPLRTSELRHVRPLGKGNVGEVDEVRVSGMPDTITMARKRIYFHRHSRAQKNRAIRSIKE
jgi:hypothetical protein